MKKRLFIAAMLLTAASALAQTATPIADAIEISYDKKIIHAGKLNFPAYTTAYQILNLLPEMFGRSEELNLENYEIKVEGVSMESFRGMALSGIKVGDILKIEIKETPIASYLKKGAAGTIDIKLNDAQEKVSGRVNLEYDTPLSASPTAIAAIKKGKCDFKVLGGVLYSDPNAAVSNESYHETKTGKHLHSTETRSDLIGWSEIVRAYMKYRPAEGHLLKVCLSEIYTSGRGDYKSYFEGSTEPRDDWSKEYARSLRLLANTEYEWTFKNRSKLDIEVNYNYSPLFNGTEMYGTDLEYTNNKHTLAGKAEYSIPLLRPESRSSVKLNIGSNYNYEFGNDISQEKNYYRDLNFYIHSNRLNLTPYLEAECKFGSFSVKGVGEYQYYRYSTDESENGSKIRTEKNNFTGKIMAGWQFHPKHNIRLILDRKLSIPSNKQLYPYLVYSSTSKDFVLGNPDLEPAVTNEIKLEYIAGVEWGRQSSLMIDAAVSYLNTENMIKSKGGQILLGFPHTFMTFENGGTNNSIAANLMLTYRTGILTAGITGNAFFNNESYNGKKDYYSNYNTTLIYSFAFGKEWSLSGNFSYYSKVNTATGSLGDCGMMSIGGGKGWKSWHLYGYVTAPLTGKTKDFLKGEVNSSYATHYLITPTAGIVLSYKF